jgi:hypothetical protein
MVKRSFEPFLGLGLFRRWLQYMKLPLRQCVMLPARAVRLVVRRYHRFVQRRRYRHQATYRLRDRALRLCPYPLELEESEKEPAWLTCVTINYLAHRFDLLGSGWVEVRHGIECGGVEGVTYPPKPVPEIDPEGRWLVGRIGAPNLLQSQRLWRLVVPPYTPIDWQLDFKSGYRWSESTWHQDIRYGHRKGADIKVPWELARMQHLVLLARAYRHAETEKPGAHPRDEYAREFRNQIIDFMATNPPQWGVNWSCPMDVAIRVANWVLSYDLFRTWGVRFDDEFELELAHGVYEHADFIFTHLETQIRANHYLADLVGLLFAASHLPHSHEAQRWSRFSTAEILAEVLHQFWEDGSSFEASTSYHRLSAEMAVYASALILGTSPQGHPVIPDAVAHRLERMAEFTQDITKSSSRVPQIGDNDSGRFFKAHPAFQLLSGREARQRYANLSHLRGTALDGPYWDEEMLDHRHIGAAAAGIFDREDFKSLGREYSFDKSLVTALARGRSLPVRGTKGGRSCAARVQVGNDLDWQRWKAELADRMQGRRVEVELPSSEGFHLYGYPGFGLYLFRSDRVYVAIRCGPLGQDGLGGHAHNDQLSVEVSVDGQDRMCDPGSYLYTPLPDWRNRYRSVRAHFAPQAKDGTEPGQLDLGPFSLGSGGEGECLCFLESGFLGRHRGFGPFVYRMVSFEKGSLAIQDFGPPGVLASVSERAADVIPFSWGYGKRGF